MILEAYCDRTSFAAGDMVNLSVFLDATARSRTVRLAVRRIGSPDQTVLSGGSSTVPTIADRFPVNCYEYGCAWPATFTFTVEPAWRSGLYLATVSGPGRSKTEVPFVVRGTGKPILMSLNFATWQAYNIWGGRSLYGALDRTEQPVLDVRRRAVKLSFDRPFARNTGTIVENTWTTWEIPFIRWAERNGYNIDYCTSIDLHSNEGVLTNRKLLTIVGHEEYWSRDMRAHVEQFILGGGNVAFFCANTCWWQIRFEDGDRTLVCYKDNPDYIPPVSEDPLRPYEWPWPRKYGIPLKRRDTASFTLTAQDVVPGIYTSDAGYVTSNWKDVPWDIADQDREYENALTGVSFEFGGGLWTGTRPAQDARFLVRGANDPVFGWVFAGTGLGNGDRFGIVTRADGTTFSVVDGECDGAEFDRGTTVPAEARLFDPASAPHTPPDLRILAVAALADWYNHGGASTRDKAWATMVAYQNNGTVFNAATTDWARGLSDGTRPSGVIDQITANVLTQLS